MSRHSESPTTSPQLGASRYKSATLSQPLQARHYAFVRYMDAPYDTQRLAVLAVDFRRALPREFTDLAPPFAGTLRTGLARRLSAPLTTVIVPCSEPSSSGPA